MKPYAEQAARLWANPMGVAQLDPATLALLARLVEMLVPLLMRCFKAPADAHAWLTRTDFTPLEKILGVERRRDREILRAVYRHWAGPPGTLLQYQRQALVAVRSGKLTAELTAGLYAEHNS